MMKKKILYSVLIVLLVSFVLAAYNAFNGNPVSKKLSQTALEHYLNDRYPEKDLRIDNGLYNFKFAEYVFEVTDTGDQKRKDPYLFSLRGFIQPEVHTDGIYEENLNEPLMERLGEEAGKEIKTFLSKSINDLKDVHVYVEVLKGKLKNDAKWEKSLRLDKPMEVHILLDAANANRKDVYKTVQKIQRLLNEEGYDYEGVTINANIFDGEDIKDEEIGYLKYSTSFEKNTEIKLKDVEELND
ncbi:hypothetical protein [Bacillus haynesii]|uniref:YfjL-like protein n=2 Tax=Bacillus haynesii TaxID=1925021 RepID=UPI002281673A|nr:hypothetical protein [Bacillus haynesii]MCY8216243.1 hypothetical protein [Bacillus haynesii]MCY8401760.1 hypothetical protein [Bacillus haynesii]MCY8578321.1 hypothetical protein [Bacillus haynesii]MCY8609246.1 hypothetical protein [Bacillus haynesii]MCY8668659.1 hypothetical protein [Bacillus haynesii]